MMEIKNNTTKYIKDVLKLSKQMALFCVLDAGEWFKCHENGTKRLYFLFRCWQVVQMS